MSQNSSRKHPSSFRRDAFLLGALPPDEAVDVEAHLRECPECRADFDEQAAAVLPQEGPPPTMRGRAK